MKKHDKKEKKVSNKNSSAAKKKLKSLDVQLKDAKQIETEKQKKTAHLKIKPVPIQEGDKVNETGRVKRNITKRKRVEADLIIANKELAFQNEEKEKRTAELIIANKELAFQNEEKEKRTAELIIANKELAFQNEEKEKRAAELIIANKELLFQNDEKEKRAAELIIANKELAFQNAEKEKHAEELNENKTLIESILDSSLSGIMAFSSIRDAEGVIVDFTWQLVNCIAERIVERSQAELVGKRMLEEMPGHRTEGLFDLYVQVVETGIPLDLEHYYEHEQVKSWFHTIAIKRLDGFVVTFSNITDRKKAEETSILLASLVEASDDAIIGKDFNGIITSWNPGAEKLFGYAANESVGRSILQIVPQDHWNEEEQLLVNIRRTGRAHRFETVRLTRDGQLINVAVTSSPIKDAAGNLVGISKVVRDITERKQAEEEIRKLNADLEHRVVMRTAQLEASNKELEAFTYSVSHDLRAPLRHISGYVQLLTSRFHPALSEKGQHYLDSIADSVHQMGLLIDNLLQFSRTGRAEMRRTDSDMNGIINEVIESLGKDNPDRSIEWTVAKLPSVFCDSAMMRLVWTNLMSNAVKFTRTREKALIEIGVKVETEEVIFFIRDNGVGFDMQYAQKLFGVFQRLHPTEEFEGTGIGLANVQRIIMRHGGRTWAEAGLDKGATFYFSIQHN